MTKYDFDLSDGRKKKKKRKRIISMLLFVVEILLAIVAGYVFVHLSIDRTMLTESYMEPTLSADTSILVNKLSYLVKEPKRYDVVVFDMADSEHSFYYVMRVIGLPRETVLVSDGEVYIDGVKLEEPIKDLERIHLAGFAEKPITLEADEYFVLADNRNNCEDSRFSSIGLVTGEQIVGKAWFTLDPFNVISKMNLKNEEKNK